MYINIITLVIIVFLLIYIMANGRKPEESYRKGVDDGKALLNKELHDQLYYIQKTIERHDDILSDDGTRLQAAYFCGVEYAILYSYINKKLCSSPDDVSLLISETMESFNDGKYDDSLTRLAIIRMFNEIEE